MRSSTTFEHGQFVIDDNSSLGELLEVQGRCQLPEEPKPKDVPAKMILFTGGEVKAAGHVHCAVRGLSDPKAWVEKIGARG